MENIETTTIPGLDETTTPIDFTTTTDSYTTDFETTTDYITTTETFFSDESKNVLAASLGNDNYFVTVLVPIIVIVVAILLAGGIACCLRRKRNLQSRDLTREDRVMASFRQKPKGVPVILKHEMFKSNGSLASMVFKKDRSSSRYEKYDEELGVPILSFEMTQIPPPPFVKQTSDPNEHDPRISTMSTACTSFLK